MERHAINQSIIYNHGELSSVYFHLAMSFKTSYVNNCRLRLINGSVVCADILHVIFDKMAQKIDVALTVSHI